MKKLILTVIGCLFILTSCAGTGGTPKSELSLDDIEYSIIRVYIGESEATEDDLVFEQTIIEKIAEKIKELSLLE